MFHLWPFRNSTNAAVFVHLLFQDVSQPLKEASCWQPILYCLQQSFVKYLLSVTEVCEAMNAVHCWSALSWKFLSISNYLEARSVIQCLEPAIASQLCLQPLWVHLCVRACVRLHVQTENNGSDGNSYDCIRTKLSWDSDHIDLVLSNEAIMQLPYLTPIVK